MRKRLIHLTMGAAGCIVALFWGQASAIAPGSSDPGLTELMAPPLNPPYLLNLRSLEDFIRSILAVSPMPPKPATPPRVQAFHENRSFKDENPIAPKGPRENRLEAQALQGHQDLPFMEDTKNQGLIALHPHQPKSRPASQKVPPAPFEFALEPPPIAPIHGKTYRIAKAKEDPELQEASLMELAESEEKAPRELYRRELPKPKIRAPERFQTPSRKDIVPSSEYVLPQDYVGKPVTLDFKDVDVRDVFRVLADVSGANIVVGEEVSGTITLYLRNVTWEKALDVVLKQKGLAMKREDGVILISSWEAIKQEDLKKPLNIEIVPIKYGNASDLAKKLEKLKSQRPDSYIGFDDRTNALIIHDTPDRIEAIRGFLDRALDIETQQCLIESRIVQMRFDALKSVGIDWRVQTWNDRAHGNAFGSIFPHEMTTDSNISFSPQQQGGGQGLQGSLGRFGGTQLPDYQGGVFTFGLTDISNTVTVDAIIRALEQKNEAKLISQPRIIVVNHTQGMIKQGVQLPVRNLSPETQNVYETEFEDANLLLEVLPHILPDGRVIMELHVTNDQPTYLSETGDYGIDKQEARSQMIVDDGQTAVIGGVFQLADQKNKGGIPLLSSIPILGYAFKRHDFQKSTMELVIFITPRIIKTGGTL